MWLRKWHKTRIDERKLKTIETSIQQKGREMVEPKATLGKQTDSSRTIQCYVLSRGIRVPESESRIIRPQT